MSTGRSEAIIKALRAVQTAENEKVINNAISCIQELNSERKSLLGVFQECANRLCEVATENLKLRGI